MLNIVMRNKEEIVESCKEGKWLYKVFCVAAVATEIISVATIALIVIAVTL